MSRADIPDEVRRRVRDRARNRCGYCLAPQHLVLCVLEIEHILPVAEGGTDDEGNLWLACRLCNNAKSDQTHGQDPHTRQRVRLFDPSRLDWWEHFAWSKDGTRVVGQTACGRATVLALNLNNLLAVEVRRMWVSVGWHPPGD